MGNAVFDSLSNKGNTTRPMSATNEDDNYSGARPKTGPFLSGKVLHIIYRLKCIHSNCVVLI